MKGTAKYAKDANNWTGPAGVRRQGLVRVVGAAATTSGILGVNNFMTARTAPPKKPVDGTRPTHPSSNPAHDRQPREIVKNWENATDTKEARFNQELVGPDGKVWSKLKPDAQRIRTDGKVDVTEVRSPSQTAKEMNAKDEQYKKILGDKAGNVTWEQPK